MSDREYAALICGLAFAIEMFYILLYS